MWEWPSVVKSSGVGEPDLKDGASDGGAALGSSIVAILKSVCCDEPEEGKV